ncbi:MAG TPA: gluconate 2-dehydrogenase subunit 3 family protein [Candidatus Acidoferrales bacterium]|nr:gluconate 2-dehydrogenase subunit 3 family protein [Candidatus Acidoferrales bacterium]
MSAQGVSRRDVLRTLAVGAVGGSVLQVIPAEAAEFVHQMVHQAKAVAPGGKYAPKYFTADQYATVTALCEMIIPKDEKSGGAVEAGAPEFIDLITSENEHFQLRLGGGLMWLDHFCSDRFDSSSFMACTPEQKKTVLDLIAFRKSANEDHTLSQGVAFFSLMRSMTCDAFYTSKIGIEDLQYIGNTSLADFPGCPALPE